VKAIDDQNISLTFSHPIDLKKTEIEFVNTETKKPRATKNIIVSKDDLRIVEIHLEGKLAADVSHDVVLKKITNTS
jgi:methionine-rich copper-binding protein CopC